MTLVAAGLFALAASRVADKAYEYNSSRAVGGLIVAGMMAGSQPQASPRGGVNQRTGLPWLSFPEVPSASAPAGGLSGPGQDADMPFLPPVLPPSQLSRATRYAEVVIFIWRRLIYGVAGMLALIALLGLATRRVRGPHLFAAAVILLTTAATVVAMRLLVDPARGAFHPLPLTSYLLAAGLQSAYAIVLLGAFARKPLAL